MPLVEANAEEQQCPGKLVERSGTEIASSVTLNSGRLPKDSRPSLQTTQIRSQAELFPRLRFTLPLSQARHIKEDVTDITGNP
jgi:hypothetical protein